MEAIEIDPKAVTTGKRYRQDNEIDDEFLESIRLKGILQPITITPEKTLIAGGRRLAAAIALGLPTIPAVVRQVEGELDLRECELIENAFRKDLRWLDRTTLVNNIHRLMEEKYGEKWSQQKTADMLNKSVGGINRQIKLAKALLQFPSLASCKTEDEAIKTYRKLGEAILVKALSRAAVAQTPSGNGDNGRADSGETKERDEGQSDVPVGIRLAKHADNHYRIGDAFVGMQEIVDAKLTPNIALVEVDPPYGIDLAEAKKGDASGIGIYNEVPKGDYPKFLYTLCHYLYKITPAQTRVIFWFGIEWYEEVTACLRETGFAIDPIPNIWVKPSGQTASPDTYLARCYETFIVAWKGKPPIRKRGRSNVFAFNSVAAAKKSHPTERPIELIQEILTTYNWPGGIVLCPFLGSGTTLRASYTCGMPCWGWELSKGYKETFLAQVQLDLENKVYDKVIGDVT